MHCRRAHGRTSSPPTWGSFRSCSVAAWYSSGAKTVSLCVKNLKETMLVGCGFIFFPYAEENLLDSIESSSASYVLPIYYSSSHNWKTRLLAGILVDGSTGCLAPAT
ncbi:hypothetical protein OUZ56_015924 [Daphnia magna]|uniref:Uncharacterized protein n=1 Tax=Daphnia magna TaxID=35525 RepID=A0ABR0AP63_9CRUS|nr:hypothetical protein OUZ56_015924 [Daphnia magna]